MTNKNTPYFRPDADRASASCVSSQPYMLAWLYWLRAWLGLTCDDVLWEEGQCFDIPKPQIIPRDTRACRRFIAHHMRGDDPHVYQGLTMRALLPRGFTRAQYRERLARVSAHGRMRILGISRAACVLLRRARLVCYDHGWWRAPMLSIDELVCPLRPP